MLNNIRGLAYRRVSAAGVAANMIHRQSKYKGNHARSCGTNTFTKTARRQNAVGVAAVNLWNLENLWMFTVDGCAV